MLAILIARAKDDSQIEEVIPHLIQNGLSILQYMEDTVLFLSHDLPKATNMKLLLSLFEQLSGLKITSIRVKFFASVRARSMRQNILNCLGMKLVNFPFAT